NNNNLEEGILRLSVNPEYRYVLAFSPKDMKYDGSFHNIKIRILGDKKLSATWRKGYFAPKEAPDDKETEKRDIDDAIFSTNGVRDLPIEMRLQFIKDDEKPVAKLSVLTLLNPPEMPMAATNGDPDTRLRILAVVFDHNGKYLGVMDKNVDVKW